MPDLFSPAGIAAWTARLVGSPRFHAAAGNWSGSVLLVEGDGSTPGRRTYLELDRGRLVAAREAGPDDTDRAEFVLHATAPTWQALVRGEDDLIAAAVRGALSLAKGQALRLLPHARAAAAMLREADGE